MPENPYHKSLRLQDFTAFRDAEFSFTPGVNAIIGENGSGKTHALKALYAWQLANSRSGGSPTTTFSGTFQTTEYSGLSGLKQLTRWGASRGTIAKLEGVYGEHSWNCRFDSDTAIRVENGLPPHAVLRPVFIPAVDMMGHTRGFVEAYSEVSLDFDITFRDVVSLMRLERRNGLSGMSGDDMAAGVHDPEQNAGIVREQPAAYAGRSSDAIASLGGLLGGTLEFEENSGRFYVATRAGRIAMPLLSEGIRKVATLLRLYRNGWLTPGTTLLWDEPEVNLNPIIMQQVVNAILALARSGVQVLLTTHSYVILKELDLQATPEDQVKFFSLKSDKKLGTQVTWADELSGLEPNAILSAYGSLYDRDLDRALGKDPRRAKV